MIIWICEKNLIGAYFIHIYIFSIYIYFNYLATMGFFPPVHQKKFSWVSSPFSGNYFYHNKDNIILFLNSRASSAFNGLQCGIYSPRG